MPFNTSQAYRGDFNLLGPWAFHGIAGQVCAIMLTDRLAKAEPYIGNAAFWSMFCIIGQPMAVSNKLCVWCTFVCLCFI